MGYNFGYDDLKPEITYSRFLDKHEGKETMSIESLPLLFRNTTYRVSIKVRDAVSGLAKDLTNASLRYQFREQKGDGRDLGNVLSGNMTITTATAGFAKIELAASATELMATASTSTRAQVFHYRMFVDELDGSSNVTATFQVDEGDVRMGPDPFTSDLS